jgi:hypothetical protein
VQVRHGQTFGRDDFIVSQNFEIVLHSDPPVRGFVYVENGLSPTGGMPQPTVGERGAIGGYGIGFASVFVVSCATICRDVSSIQAGRGLIDREFGHRPSSQVSDDAECRVVPFASDETNPQIDFSIQVSSQASHRCEFFLYQAFRPHWN